LMRSEKARAFARLDDLEKPRGARHPDDVEPHEWWTITGTEFCLIDQVLGTSTYYLGGKGPDAEYGAKLSPDNVAVKRLIDRKLASLRADGMVLFDHPGCSAAHAAILGSAERGLLRRLLERLVAAANGVGKMVNPDGINGELGITDRCFAPYAALIKMGLISKHADYDKSSGVKYSITVTDDARQLVSEGQSSGAQPVERDRTVTFPEAIMICNEAIATYRANRDQLVRTYAELNAIGGRWEPRCQRDTGKGGMRWRGIVIQGQGSGVLTETNPFAPFRDVRLLDSSGNAPNPSTPVYAIQQKMAYFMEEIRRSAMALSYLLPQLATAAPDLGIDPTPLTQLRHRLANFPFVPVRSRKHEIPTEFGNVVTKTDEPANFSPAERERALAEDEPFFAGAKVALEHILQAYMRVRRAVAEEKQDPMARAPSAASLLDRVERAKNLSPLHKALYGISLVVAVLIVVFWFIGD
jgi:hypothetical protein